MKTNRLEAFSDGVLAIIITIMVMQLRAPKEITWEALVPILPVLVSYLQAEKKIQPQKKQNVNKLKIMNLHLCYWRR